MSKPGTRTLRGLRPAAALCAAFAATLMLTACESSDDAGDAGGNSAPVSKPAANRPVKSASADMVTAVSAKGGGMVELGFAIQKRPKVGEPVEIEFAITPSVDLERVFARFQAAEGLQIVSGAETDHLEKPAKGVPVSHVVTLLPKTDGIFYVTAVVLADSDKESVARTFTVPLIAGQGLTELPAAPPAASTADPKSATATP
jgi:hypothetical protein